MNKLCLKTHRGGLFFGRARFYKSVIVKTPKQRAVMPQERNGKIMKQRRWVAALLAMAMLLSLLTGCGSGNGTSSTGTGGNSQSQTEETETSSTGETDEDVYTVRVMNIHTAKTEDCEEVSEYISSITRDLVGANVEIVAGVTGEQVNLALTSGEKMDLLSAFSWVTPFSNLISNGQILPLDDLLAEYGAEMLDMISEADWKCVSMNGQIYGVPTNKDKAQTKAFQMRKDYVDQLNIDVDSIKNLDDLEAVLRQVKEELPDVYPVVSAAGGIGLPLLYDDLSDGFGVLEDMTSDDTTVVNLYETKSYEDMVNRMYRWAQDGLIMPDASSNTSSIEQLLGAGTGFGGFVPSKPGATLQASREAGTELVQVQLTEAFSTTGMVAAPYCIAASSENPEKAMQVLNLMYTNADVSNAFIYGLEGKHWQWVDKENNVVGYADGITTENTGYSVLGWSWPNQQVGAIWDGDELDIWAQLSTFNAEATASPAKGFTWDNSSVLNEVTACQNVTSKYKNALECGMLNPAETLPQMNQELKDAGLETIIAEKQAQLDAWLAEQE